MTSYEFEKAAKNAVVKVLKDSHGIDTTHENLQFVWFAHELGYKKCTLYAPELGPYYPEVTYNLAKDEMYVDIYRKITNVRISGQNLEFSTHA